MPNENMPSLPAKGDMAVQRPAAESHDHPSAVQLTGIYHHLIRMWTEI
jgi:PKHD-type hydroxylase